MTASLQPFHQQVSELLRSVGFTELSIATDQEVVSLRVDDAFDLHCIGHRAGVWVLLAEFASLTEQLQRLDFTQACLRYNQPAARPYAPMIGMSAQQRPVLWVELPIGGLADARLRELFAEFIKEAERLANGTLLEIAPPPNASAPHSRGQRLRTPLPKVAQNGGV